MNVTNEESRHLEAKVVYAVYYEMDSYYDPSLASLWTDEASANIAAKALQNRGIYNRVFVAKVQLDKEELYGD